MARVGGIVRLTIDGLVVPVKDSVTWNLGRSKREAVIGADFAHGYKEMPQIGFLECELTNTQDISVEEIIGKVDATCVLELPNGDSFTLRNAWYAADGDNQTEEGNVQCRFEGMGELDEA